MTGEEAEKYADNMTYRGAINNLMKARSIPYRKATFIKINELLKALEQQPCENCISREAVIKYICESKECYKDECKGRLYKRCYDLQWIYDLPSVQPTRPRGKIICKAPYGWGYCSECNHVVEPQDRFCSFCGTKMEEEE